ncbi:hypothetical protein ACFCW6_06650 [Streptomyces sp. NPDC056333]
MTETIIDLATQLRRHGLRPDDPAGGPADRPGHRLVTGPDS